MNYVDSNMIQEYIENEKNYIKQDMSTSGYSKDLLLDLNMLENLTEEDIEDITQKVNDDEELINKINELIHYWLYHR